jgi:hypothetical protein
MHSTGSGLDGGRRTLGFALAPMTQAIRAADQSKIALGKNYLLRYGVGWGAAHPRMIFNGGVPSGKAWTLRWSDWEQPSLVPVG